MSHFSFEFPYAYLLLPLFWFCLKKCRAKTMAIYLPYIEVLIGKKSLKSRWLDFIKWGAIFSVITALASPVKVTTFTDTHQEARDIMLVIDSSKSMLDRGFDANNPTKDKFTAVKEVVRSFINDRKNDRVGLITFASSAFIASPLTFDRKYLQDILLKQKVGIVGSRTAINDALLQALYTLEASKVKSKIIILLTDGIDNMSETPFADLVDVLKESKIKLYTIGIGDFKDLEVPKLKALANAGRGKFFMTTNKKTLSKIYAQIDASETTKVQGKTYKRYKYFYYFPLMIGIILLLIYVYSKSVRGVAR